MAGNSENQGPPPAKRRRGPGRQFQKGVSGNPSGRPKDVAAIRSMIRARGGDFIMSLMVTALDRRHKDHVRACQALLEYGYGKPTQLVELSGVDGEPIKTEIDARVAFDNWTSEQRVQRMRELLAKGGKLLVPDGAPPAPGGPPTDGPGGK